MKVKLSEVIEIITDLKKSRLVSEDGFIALQMLEKKLKEKYGKQK